MPDPINVPTPPSRRRGDMTPPRRGATNNRGRTTLGTPPSVPSAPGVLPDLGNIPGPRQRPGRTPEATTTPRRTPTSSLKVPGLAPSRGPVHSPNRTATPNRTVRQERVVNQYDDGEDPFEQIPIQDQVDVEDYEDYEAERVEVDTTPERQPPRRTSTPSNADSGEDNYENTTEPAPKKKGMFGRKAKSSEPVSKKHTKSSAGSRGTSLTRRTSVSSHSGRILAAAETGEKAARFAPRTSTPARTGSSRSMGTASSSSLPV